MGQTSNALGSEEPSRRGTRLSNNQTRSRKGPNSYATRKFEPRAPSSTPANLRCDRLPGAY